MTRIHRNRSHRWWKLIIGLLIVTLTLGGTAWARPSGHRGRTPYPRAGKIYRRIPSHHQSVRWGGHHYLFHKGVYYRREHRGYRVVRPSRGVVISHLPLGFETLVVAGMTYFLLAGVYYRQTSAGYVVVDPPPPPPAPPVIATDSIGRSLAVNVPMLNVRSGPSMGHQVINQVRLGDRLVIQGTSPGWYYVRLPGGSFGWVMAKFTRAIDPDPRG